MRRVLAALALGAAACGPTPAQIPAGPAAAARGAPASAAEPQAPPRKAAEPSSARPLADSYSEPEGGTIEDDFEASVLSPSRAARAPHPLDGASKRELERRLLHDPGSLGALSIGRPSAGRLLNAVQMPVGERWELVSPAHAWGTPETVEYLKRAIDAVHERFPGSPKLYIGHISAQNGGPLAPHVSHQCGRDVDISFFYLKGHRWYGRATAQNLDRPRTWAFVRALVTETDVDMILIDASLQRLLREYAERSGESPAWLDSLFRGAERLPPLIRHAPGHATHLHVRFHNPIAQETARRVYPLLLRHRRVAPPAQFVRHRVKDGETLGKLAKRYGTTIPAIQRANGLRKKTLIRAGRVYLIPRAAGGTPAVPAPVAVPPRRLPPTRVASGR
jgi:penicillin-insensitive murein endopeptidase